MVLDLPVQITSGMVAPPIEAAAPFYNGPPAALDLPPYISSLLTFQLVTETCLNTGLIGLLLIGLIPM